MSVDLKTNEVKLLNAWKDVTDEQTPTDWALFGYDGHSNTLKVVSSGDGGLIELAEDLNSNQIMYGFCRLPDPKTGLSKFVLIYWQGEGAPMARKGACASHQRQVASLLHGHHLTVHARDEDEVDEAAVLEKLARAGSSSYNFHQRVTETSPQTKPVGTNYRRVVPAAEIDLSARDRFWEQQEQEEKLRRAEEQQRHEQERARLETERNRREMEEARGREHAALERSRSINEARQAERKADRLTSSADQEAHRWQATLEQDRIEEQERAHRADKLRAERKQEAELLIGHRTGAARAVFERNTSAGQMRSPTSPTSAAPPHAGRGVARRWPPATNDISAEAKPRVNGSISSASVSNGHISSSRTAPEASPPALPQSAPPQPGSREPQPPAARAPEPPAEPAPAAMEPSKPPEWSTHQPTLAREPTDGTSAAPAASISHMEPVINAPGAFQQPQPARSLPELESVRSAPELEPVRSVSEPEAVRSSEPLVPVEPLIQQEPVKQPDPVKEPEPIQQPERLTEPEPAKQPEPLRQAEPQFYDAASEPATAVGNGGVDARVAPAAAATGTISEVQITTVTGELASVSLSEEHGLCAQALYDYQAADDTEITFDPGDIITNIDRIDEGWWQGVSPTGQFGLFPANYVQLIN